MSRLAHERAAASYGARRHLRGHMQHRRALRARRVRREPRARDGGGIRTSIDERRLAHPDALATAQLEELERLVQAHRNGRVAILELGVGLRNGIIKHMLAQIANVCEHATYIVFNYSQAMAPDASCETILVDGDMAPAFEEIAQCRL